MRREKETFASFDGLRESMKRLAAEHGLDRVEVELKDGRSVLYLPGLGWTMKGLAASWATATIIGHDR